MSPLLALLQAASLMPGPLPRQPLPARGCAAYLWTRGDTPALVATAGAEPQRLRLSLAGRVQEMERTGSVGDSGFGLARTAEYRAGELSATLDLAISTRPDLAQGGVVTDATLTLARPGADTLVLPVGGLVGCPG